MDTVSLGFGLNNAGSAGTAYFANTQTRIPSTECQSAFHASLFKPDCHICTTKPDTATGYVGKYQEYYIYFRYYLYCFYMIIFFALFYKAKLC